MKVYEGARERGQMLVWVHDGPRDYPLVVQPDLGQAGASGFNWGTINRGARQLAAALIADGYGVELAVPRMIAHVLRELVSRLPHDTWAITEEQLAWAVAAARQAMQEGSA